MANRAQRGSYPYPFLDDTSEVLADFSISQGPFISPQTSEVEIAMELTLSNSIRTNLVEKGPLRIITRWECSATLQSGSTQISTHNAVGDTLIAKVRIDLTLIAEQVKVWVFLISAFDLDQFRWPAQDEIYGDATFAVAKGDRMGLAGEFSFDAERWFDPMVPPIESCIEFVQDLRNTLNFSVDLSNDVIKVMLPNHMFKGFVLQAQRPLMQQTTVLVPALMHTVAEMRNNPDDFMDKAWYRSLDHLLTMRKLTDASVLEAVQVILDNPARSILLEDLQGMEDEDE